VIDAATRRRVRRRAHDRCEYCGLPQDAVPVATFHIEHIIAKQHGGTDDLSNLALACFHCNQHKGPNLTGIDPQSGQITPLFNPRTQLWREHFALQDTEISGLTPTGRATIRVLAMNSELQQQLRTQLR
jgi:5-methylcytosine-specific restriction endonuclease McrA